MKKSEVPEKWRNMRPQTLKVLKARNWHDPREHKDGALTPDEQGLSGPIQTSIAYGFQWADDAASVFQGMRGYAYPRLPYGTPAVQKLGKKILDLELGKNHPNKNDYDVLISASGMSSIAALTLALVPFGGEFISSPYVYGGTYNLFNDFLPQTGRKCFFIKDPRDLDEWESMMKCRPMASFLFWENDPNPTPFKLDGAGIVRRAQKYRKRTFCDNTIPTPILEQPLLYGVDGVIESTSKNIGGKSRGLGGSNSARKEIIKEIRESWAVVLGAIMDPRVADYMLLGIKTLKKRMERKIKNARCIAGYLEDSGIARKVYWSGSDLLSFELEGSLEEAKRLVENFRFILMAPHLGDDCPLGIHPASTTHARVPPEERLKLGIADTLIRLSPGLVDPLDVVDDIDQAHHSVYV
ncbi:MAG: PLP-dependent transferase [bacterium]|nr:PLP-dependent transferase [bacterium]